MNAVFPCDLHSHTNRSDGNDTVRELIDHASEIGVKILAITDHDITLPEQIDVDGRSVSPVAYGVEKNVRILPGIEFSCDTLIEDVHIVALGCDYKHPFFEKEYQASIRSKIDGYRTLVERLNVDGMTIDWQRDILRDGAVEETAVQRKMIFEAMALNGYSDDWSNAKLLVKNTPRYAVKREKPNPVHIIHNIHAAGGIAILAHPFLIAEHPETAGGVTTREDYIERLIESGLDGMEAAYPYDKTSYDGTMTPEEAEAAVREKYGSRLAVMSGGSDYHNEGKKGSKNPRLLGERGITMEYFLANPLLSKLI